MPKCQHCFLWICRSSRSSANPDQGIHEITAVTGSATIQEVWRLSTSITLARVEARYKDRFECHVLTLAGFAGVPRIPAPMLEQVREGIAAYIRKNKLDHPAIVGHSLGGFLALDLAAHYPDLPGRLVIVDAYALTAAIVDAKATAEQARAMA